jgi:Tfp pilus assembly protein FimV
MGKKKSGNGKGGQASARDSSDNLAAASLPETPSSVVDTSNGKEGDAMVLDLQQQLVEARREIEALKAQLAAKDAELAALKDGNACGTVQDEQVMRLQERWDSRLQQA